MYIEILHILRSSCLKFQARRSVPEFSRNEPLPVQDPDQARINSVQKKRSVFITSIFKSLVILAI